MLGRPRIPRLAAILLTSLPERGMSQPQGAPSQRLALRASEGEPGGPQPLVLHNSRLPSAAAGAFMGAGSPVYCQPQASAPSQCST